MIEIITQNRKSSILTRPTLACLKDYHAINLTAGCPYECRYCYAREYSNNPGSGRIIFYANSEEKLAAELAGKRRKPKMVYFSTATDPFIPFPKILDSQFRIMEMLLQNRISIFILTKAKIPNRFINLFGNHCNQVQVQIGLTTMDDRVRKLIEPNAATVKQRLQNMSALLAQNIITELRMDPLIPLLTDTDRSLRTLLREVADIGCRQAVASFLHLRRANREPMMIEYGDWNFVKIKQRLFDTTVQLVCGGTEILLPSATYRRERYKAISQIGAEFGIEIKFCGCKNPDITSDRCHPQPKNENEQMALNL